MSKLIYISDIPNNREAKEIQFSISNDLDIYEFKIVCKRLASAMGYHSNSIQRAFSDDTPNFENEEKLFELGEIFYHTTGSQISI